MASNPSIEGIENATSNEVIASVAQGEAKWFLELQTDENSGGIFVLKQENGDKIVIGGDSSPFPLSKYGVPESVVKQLAAKYVEWEIKNTEGGLEAVQQQVQERDKLPHDLIEAYSKYFPVNVRPVYATNDPSLNNMIDALNKVKTAKNDTQKDAAVNQKLQPVIDDVIDRLATKPQNNLAQAVLHATSMHPEVVDLQLATAIYAGRQPQHFIDTFNKMDCTKKCRALVYALKSSVDSGLVGLSVRDNVKRVLGAIDTE
jgi:hypothetical protein